MLVQIYLSIKPSNEELKDVLAEVTGINPENVMIHDWDNPDYDNPKTRILCMVEHLPAGDYPTGVSIRSWYNEKDKPPPYPKVWSIEAEIAICKRFQCSLLGFEEIPPRFDSRDPYIHMLVEKSGKITPVDVGEHLGGLVIIHRSDEDEEQN